MDRPTLIRTAALMIPACWATVALAVTHPSQRVKAGLLLSFLWNLPALTAVNWLAQRLDWWQFQAEGGLLLDMPLDLLIGWALLWGPLAALAALWLSMPLVILVVVALDLLLMPACAPVVQLGPHWLAGEAATVLTCLMPGLLFARWTRNRTRLSARAVMQFLTFLGLFVFLIPAIVIEAGFAVMPTWSRWDLVWIQVIVVFALPGVSAMQEFVKRGGGTPFPYDHPDRLVFTGPYAYICNPMQVSNTLLFVGLALLLRSPIMVGGAVVSLAYSAGLARWHEEEELVPRWGEEWLQYRANVRSWIPRWRPWRCQSDRLYVAAQCEICQSVEAWLLKRSPVALEIIPAEHHPGRDLFRITYNDGGHEVEGVAAIGRALEHLNFGWAMIGFFVRLPVVRLILQVLSDGAVAPPRRVKRKAMILK